MLGSKVNTESYRVSVVLNCEILVMTGESSNIFSGPLLVTRYHIKTKTLSVIAFFVVLLLIFSKCKALLLRLLIAVVCSSLGLTVCWFKALSRYCYAAGAIMSSDKCKKWLTIWFVCSSLGWRIFVVFSAQVFRLVPSSPYSASTHSNCPLKHHQKLQSHSGSCHCQKVCSNQASISDTKTSAHIEQVVGQLSVGITWFYTLIGSFFTWEKWKVAKIMYQVQVMQKDFNCPCY